MGWRLWSKKERDEVNSGIDPQTQPLKGVSELEQKLTGDTKSYVGFAQKKLWSAQYFLYRLEAYERSIPNRDTQLWGASVPLDAYTLGGLGFAWSVLDTLAVVIVDVYVLPLAATQATFARIGKGAEPGLAKWRSETESGKLVTAFIEGPQGKHLHELRTQSYHHYISTAYEVQLTVGAAPRYGSNLPAPGMPRHASTGLRAELGLRAFVDEVTKLVDAICGRLANEGRLKQ